jgi:2',3'-cyclic-nucleotide 2'-phosphodiesterase (5'-nucleotidase family)
MNINGVRVGVLGAALETTPELVSAGATEGLTFLPAAPALKAESERLRKRGIKVQIVVIHEGTSNGRNSVGTTPSTTWDGPIVTIAEALDRTTVDAIIAGHTHRVSNSMVGDILVTEGINAGASYSVLQLMVKGGDVEWAGGATRIAKTIGVTPDPAAQAIITAANDATAILRNKVIGTQAIDIKRDPARLIESAMGNLVADAMRAKYPGVDVALANSGGLRADLVVSPPSAGEAAGEVTWGEVFAVLPFANRTVIATYTGAQIRVALENGASPNCDPAIHSGRTPQLSGMRMTFTCNGLLPVITGMWLTPQGIGGPETPITDTTSVRMVINDFVYTGGDGYTNLIGGTDVLQPGDDLMDLVITWIAGHSPVSAAVEGRFVKQP